jgi:hypothetical protein
MPFASELDELAGPLAAFDKAGMLMETAKTRPQRKRYFEYSAIEMFGSLSSPIDSLFERKI